MMGGSGSPIVKSNSSLGKSAHFKVNKDQYKTTTGGQSKIDMLYKKWKNNNKGSLNNNE
jgi:hypothetical protein